MRLGQLFVRIGAAARPLPVILCAFLLAGCELRLGKPTSLLDDEPAVAKAIGAIESHFVGPMRIYKVALADVDMIVQAPYPTVPGRLGEWRLTREHQEVLFWTVSWDRLSGPHPVNPPMGGPVPINPKFEDKVFDLKEVNFADWPKVADAAIARAALEGKGGVSTIEIARMNVLLPGSSGTALRWVIEVKSEREQARVFANAKGEITGANLNATNRMKNLDMYQRPELAADAAADLRDNIGREPILMRVSFSSASIRFETTLKDESYPIGGIRANAVFSWSYNGLQRTMGSADTHFGFSNPNVPFGIDDVDWTLLPKIVVDARSKLAIPDGRVTTIDVITPTDGAGTPVPLWRIYIEESGERGEYTADMKGVAKTVLLPKSRRKPTAWLDPAVMAQTLAQMAADFGADGQIVKIFIEHDGGRVIAADSRKPGQLMEALLREDGLKRWGTPMFEGGTPFPASELVAFTADRLGALLERTRKELDMPDAAIRDITISRNGLGMSDRAKVAVTMMVRTPRGRLGRVVQALDGTLGEVHEWRSGGSRP